MKQLPNILTFLRTALVPIFVVLYYLPIEGWNYYAAGVFIFACITDILDGAIARKYRCESDIGKLLDPMADKLLMASALILLIDWGKLPSWLVIILIAREFIISGFRLMASTKGVVIAADWVGKIKTLTQDVGVALILLGNPWFSQIGVPLGEIIVYISAVFAIWSCISYIIKNCKVMKQN